MKKILILGLGVAALVIVVGLAVLLSRGLSSHNAQPQSGATTFPVSSTTSGTNSSMTIALSDGSSVRTNDFVNNGVTIADPANAGNYYLQGTSGACLPNGTCPMAGGKQKFTIVYFASQQAFGINLDDEPLGEARAEAEAFLTKALGLTHDQMCKLNYTLGTTGYVSTTYGGMGNLGFSFCPGAVQLPF